MEKQNKKLEEYRQEYRRKNRESIRAYRLKNRDKMNKQYAEWRKKNPGYMKAYRKRNREKLSQQNAEWRKTHRDQVLAGKKRWYSKHHDKILAYHKRYYNDNKDVLLTQMRQYAKKIRPLRTVYENNYRRRRESLDPAYLLGRRLRSRARIAFTKKGLKKKESFNQLLGGTYEQARMHVESLFTERMSWENYGEWHIDHIRPLCSFDLTKPDGQRKAFHYTNLQPLWAQDNLKKGKKTLL